MYDLPIGQGLHTRWHPDARQLNDEITACWSRCSPLADVFDSIKLGVRICFEEVDELSAVPRVVVEACEVVRYCFSVRCVALFVD